MEEKNEKIELIKEKVYKHPNAVSLIISRLPDKTRDVFVKYANDEFVGDYGLALKALCDKVLVDVDKFAMVCQALDDHEQRLNKIEGNSQGNIVRKTLSGREIKR